MTSSKWALAATILRGRDTRILQVFRAKGTPVQRLSRLRKLFIMIGEAGQHGRPYGFAQSLSSGACCSGRGDRGRLTVLTDDVEHPSYVVATLIVRTEPSDADELDIDRLIESVRPDLLGILDMPSGRGVGGVASAEFQN